MLQNSPMYAYIPARAVNRARKFYEDKLGLKPKQETAGTSGGAKAAWFSDTEGNILALIQNA